MSARVLVGVIVQSLEYVAIGRRDRRGVAMARHTTAGHHAHTTVQTANWRWRSDGDRGRRMTHDKDIGSFAGPANPACLRHCDA